MNSTKQTKEDTLFEMPDGYCFITGLTEYKLVTNHRAAKKKKRDKYREKQEQQTVVVAMYDEDLKAIIINK